MSRFVARGIDFGTVRTEFHLPDGYPPAAVAQARTASDRFASGRQDRTDLAFVTIDPPDSMDLDQALHLERTADGFVLHYAIADVGAVVEPGGVLDVETRKRGQTFYLPDGKVPLHPQELSEGSASLLPGEDRPAVVWRIELDESAEPLSCTVSRATVRSVARLEYSGVQADAEAGRLHPSIASLPEFGRLRTAAAVARGAIELRLPEQEVVPDGDSWRVDLAPRTEADDWNAEVSLLTGMCAAAMMLDAKIGLLRTLPPAGPDAVGALRRTAAALGVDWPESVGVGELLARLDPNSASTLVLMTEAPSLLRGADYAAFDGTLPELTAHAAIGAPYAHVTAPLRRLSDRYSTEVCLAVSAGTPVPSWARDALGSMPEIMGGSDSLASKIDRACIDLTEATVLADRVGETFDATVLRSRNGKRTADVFVPSVSVMAKCVGDPAEGEQVKIRLVSADVAKRTVEFGYPA
ncbi:RNB domain-containing ribonuclease [Rhodococcus sp. ACS1]|uniref:VacB and RNase II family 3'-5' exoribonucleases n=1 Tax=Rhodococcus koreensis TaxID=99653 RepID=A0A1H5AQG2_9NOCA|nr:MULTISPECIES: RNB domain-containing ribonuclease [Rhodococcus]PBC39050.1 RNB domain-containing ribonuclease [Rhodococcus sp. ACS1]QSE78745.1 RNB domain-containing ribonuclease [Rhodococcus koreensis]SED44607.1 VacB and RNase II family 3'-5' exoribonucleases [Rhodococcus koreensis]